MLDLAETWAFKGLEIEPIIQLMEPTGMEIKEKLPKVYSKDFVEVIL